MNLNFNLNTTQERLNFVQSYLSKNSAPSQSDLEMLSNFILWADEKENGTNYQIESKNSPWKRRQDLSYESLLEQESENGTPLVQMIDSLPIAHKNNKLDRSRVETAIKNTPMEKIWRNLWQRIDQTEFQVQTWELLNGKRKTPIREDLYRRLGYDKSLIDRLTESCKLWTPYEHLKKKRHLVQLRTEQYGLLEGIGQNTQIKKHPNPRLWWSDQNSLAISFFPFMDKRLLINKIEDSHFDKFFQALCTYNLKQADQLEKDKNFHFLKLTDPQTIRVLLLGSEDLRANLPIMSIENKEIVETLLAYLDYYIEKSEFAPFLSFILKAKIKKMSNMEILKILQKDYGMEYKNANYISTIFTRRIIKVIADQAQRHYNLIEYITMGKNVFKKCSVCGLWLPRNTEYFTKRNGTSDGFFSSCKKCKRGSVKK